MDINTIKKLYNNNTEIKKRVTHSTSAEDREAQDRLLNEKISERYEVGPQIYTFGYYNEFYSYRVDAYEYTEKVIRNPVYRHLDVVYTSNIDPEQLLDQTLETIKFYELLENPQVRVYCRHEGDNGLEMHLCARN